MKKDIRYVGLDIDSERAAVAVADADASEVRSLGMIPHTAESVINDKWEHAYTREEAAFPRSVDRASKYWPPVRRIDGAYGDRNLICSCPAPEAFE